MFKTHLSVVKLETSLINNKNNKGSNTESWGAPLYASKIRSYHVENIPFGYDFLGNLKTN